MIRIELPLPPSANGAYVNVPGRGRVPSKAHKAWKNEAGWLVQRQRFRAIQGRYRFEIHLPDRMRGDVDGRIKLAQDLLVELGVTPDDRYAVSSHAERSETVPAKRCIIVVSEMA
jgi:crossover junction endodeoxyribonuclease RusA